MANDRGRQPIGFEQPPNSGTSYPFVRVSDDIAQLFADFFLSYEGAIDDTPSVPYTYPFRLAWCVGFGSVPGAPSGTWPTPTHAYDIVIHDAEGRLVFDSTTSTQYATELWDDRLRIVEWADETRVCRCVVHAEWSAEDIAASQDREYRIEIAPEASDLVPDTCYEMPPRVRSLRVNATTIKNKRVEFVEGYNVSLTDTATTIVAAPLVFGNSPQATRSSSQVVFNAIPGAGTGTFPGCGDQPVVLKTINYQTGSDHQNFTIDASGCIRIQRPVVLTNETPREFAYGRVGSSNATAAASIQLSNDCKNCCDCESFARTYQGIKRQWFLHQEIAQSLARSRDVYSANRDRWLVEKASREADLLRVRAVIEGGSKVAWGVSLCNASKCCLLGLKVYLTWVQYINGEPVAPTITPYDCSQTLLDSSSNCAEPSPITPIVYGAGRQIHCYVVDYMDAQGTLSIYGRECFPDAKNLPFGSAKLVLHAMVEWDATKEVDEAAEACLRTPLEAESVAEDVREVWAAASFSLPARAFAQKSTPLKIVDPSDPFCRSCQCED